MIGFILTGHGQFAPGLASAVRMVAGDRELFDVVPFEDLHANSYREDLYNAISSMREKADGVLVFVDLLGGTPFNQAMIIAQEIDDVEVVAGTNLPMLIELVLTGENSSLDELVERALSVGREGITHRTINIDQDQDELDDFDGEGI